MPESSLFSLEDKFNDLTDQELRGLSEDQREQARIDLSMLEAGIVNTTAVQVAKAINLTSLAPENELDIRDVSDDERYQSLVTEYIKSFAVAKSDPNKFFKDARIPIHISPINYDLPDVTGQVLDIMDSINKGRGYFGGTNMIPVLSDLEKSKLTEYLASISIASGDAMATQALRKMDDTLNISGADFNSIFGEDRAAAAALIDGMGDGNTRWITNRAPPEAVGQSDEALMRRSLQETSNIESYARNADTYNKLLETFVRVAKSGDKGVTATSQITVLGYALTSKIQKHLESVDAGRIKLILPKASTSKFKNALKKTVENDWYLKNENGELKKANKERLFWQKRPFEVKLINDINGIPSLYDGQVFVSDTEGLLRPALDNTGTPIRFSWR